MVHDAEFCLESAAAHEHDPLGNLSRESHLVRDHHHGHPLLGDSESHVPCPAASDTLGDRALYRQQMALPKRAQRNCKAVGFLGGIERDLIGDLDPKCLLEGAAIGLL